MVVLGGVQLVGDSGSTVVDDSQTVNDEVEFTEVRGAAGAVVGRAAGTCDDGGGVFSLVRGGGADVLLLLLLVLRVAAVSWYQGLSIDRGYVSPYFVKDQERQLVELRRPRVLVTEGKVSAVHEILPLLEHIAKRCGTHSLTAHHSVESSAVRQVLILGCFLWPCSKEPLFIVAEDVSGEALSALVVNKMRGVLDVVAIKVRRPAAT